MCMLVVMNNYSFKKYIKLCLVFCACTILGLLAKSSQKDILNLSINEKVSLDVEYKENISFWFDLKILWMTLLKVINSQGISH